MMCENVIGARVMYINNCFSPGGGIPNQQILVSRINYQTRVNIIINATEGRQVLALMIARKIKALSIKFQISNTMFAHLFPDICYKKYSITDH